MTTVAIHPETDNENGSRFLAVSGRQHSVGRTAGEALDALTTQLDESRSGTLVIVQTFRPDGLFTAAQQQRLETLMASWRRGRDTGAGLPPGEQRELEALIDAELRAAAQRAEDLERAGRL